MGQLLWGIGAGLLFPLWPLHLDALGASSFEIGLLFAIGNAVTAVGVLGWGWAADRVGRRTVIVATSLAGTLGAASLVPLADWRPAVISSVLFWTSAAALPVMSAHAASITDRAALGRAMGYVYGAFFLGNVLAAPVAGPLAASLGLPLAIAASAAAFAISTAAFATIGPGRTRRDVVKARPRRAFWVILGLAPFAALVAVTPAPLLPVYLRDVAGVPLERIGLLGGLFPVGAAVLSTISGRLADRFGSGLAIGLNAACVVAGAIVLSLLGRSEVVLAVGIFLLGAAFGVNPVVAAALERAVPAGRIALAYAGFQTAYSAGLAAGGILSGALYAADPILPFLVTGALALPVATAVAFGVSSLAPARQDART